MFENIRYLMTVANTPGFLLRHLCKSYEIRQLVTLNTVDQLADGLRKAVLDEDEVRVYAYLISIGFKSESSESIKELVEQFNLSIFRWHNELTSFVLNIRSQSTTSSIQIVEACVGSNSNSNASTTSAKLILPSELAFSNG
jgi:hypothetical protein